MNTNTTTCSTNERQVRMVFNSFSCPGNNIRKRNCRDTSITQMMAVTCMTRLIEYLFCTLKVSVLMFRKNNEFVFMIVPSKTRERSASPLFEFLYVSVPINFHRYRFRLNRNPRVCFLLLCCWRADVQLSPYCFRSGS